MIQKRFLSPALVTLSTAKVFSPSLPEITLKVRVKLIKSTFNGVSIVERKHFSALRRNTISYLAPAAILIFSRIKWIWIGVIIQSYRPQPFDMSIHKRNVYAFQMASIKLLTSRTGAR